MIAEPVQTALAPDVGEALAFVRRRFEHEHMGFVVLVFIPPVQNPDPVQCFVPLQLPERWERARTYLERYASTHDSYLTVGSFLTSRNRKAENVAQLHALICERDDAPPTPLVPDPTIITETSPGRFQDYLDLERPVDAATYQDYTRRIAAAHGIGNQAVDAARVLRIPGTINFGVKQGKAVREPNLVRLVSDTGERFSLAAFAHLPPALRPIYKAEGVDLTSDADGFAAWAKATDPRRAGCLRARLHRVAAGDNEVPKDDGTPYPGESERREGVLIGLFLAGLTDDEVRAAFMTTERWRRCVADHGEADAHRRLITQDMATAKGFAASVREKRDKRAREQVETLARAHNLDVDPETGEVLPPPPISPPPADEAEAAPPAPTPRRPFTDLGNAERLIDRFDGTMRYVVERSEWAIYTGTRWTIDTTGEAKRRAYATVRNMYREAGDDEDYKNRTELAKHAMKSEAAARVAALLDLARWLDGVPVSVQDFDRDPWLLNCTNGALDLRTGTLRPHIAADLLMKQVPVAYDENAACPLWDAFLAQAMEPHPDQIEFLRRAVGYSLTADIREEVFFLMYGAGGNGKGVFTETVQAIQGDYAQQAEMRLLMVRRSDADATPDIARLAGARTVFASESEDGARFNEAKVKTLTGGDMLMGRFLFQNPFEFRPSHKLWLASNHKPVIRGTDEGIWRRILLIPFDVTFRGEHKDPTLKRRLREELPGILAWAVRGCLEWQRDGLGVPTDITDATSEYRREMDTLAAFLADRCEEGKRYFVTSAALYKAYRDWCDETGERYEPQNGFGIRLRGRGYTDDKHAGKRGWYGLRLLTEPKQEAWDT